MDTQRLILVLIFSFSAFMLFEAWQRETRGPVAPIAETKEAKPATETTPQPSIKLEPPSAPGSAPSPPSAAGASETIRIHTDVLSLDVDLVGATLVRVELTRHRGTVDTTKNFVLLERSAQHTYIAQSGLIGEGLPNHNSRFTAAAKEFRLADGQERLEVPLEAQGADGVRLR